MLASYEIRLPDINKEPFEKNGCIELPVPEVRDPKRLGLTQIKTVVASDSAQNPTVGDDKKAGEQKAYETQSKPQVPQEPKK